MTKNVSTAIEADVIVAPNHALTNYQKKKDVIKAIKFIENISYVWKSNHVY